MQLFEVSGEMLASHFSSVFDVVDLLDFEINIRTHAEHRFSAYLDLSLNEDAFCWFCIFC